MVTVAAELIEIEGIVAVGQALSHLRRPTSIDRPEVRNIAIHRPGTPKTAPSSHETAPFLGVCDLRIDATIRHSKWASIFSTRWALGTAPITVSTSSPSLKSSTAGMERTLNRIAVR